MTSTEASFCVLILYIWFDIKGISEKCNLDIKKIFKYSHTQKTWKIDTFFQHFLLNDLHPNPACFQSYSTLMYTKLQVGQPC